MRLHPKNLSPHPRLIAARNPPRGMVLATVFLAGPGVLLFEHPSRRGGT